MTNICFHAKVSANLGASMEKKFSWNTTVVYNLPYTLSLGISPSVTVPNHEAIYAKVEDALEKMSSYDAATEVMARIKQKFDNK